MMIQIQGHGVCGLSVSVAEPLLSQVSLLQGRWVKLQPHRSVLFSWVLPHLATAKAATSALPLYLLPSTKEKLSTVCLLWSHQSKLVSFCPKSLFFNVVNWNYYFCLTHWTISSIGTETFTCILKSLACSTSSATWRICAYLLNKHQQTMLHECL